MNQQLDVLLYMNPSKDFVTRTRSNCHLNAVAEDNYTVRRVCCVFGLVPQKTINFTVNVSCVLCIR